MQLGDFPPGRVFWFRFEGIEGFSRYGSRKRCVGTCSDPAKDQRERLAAWIPHPEYLSRMSAICTVSSLTLYLNKSLIKRDSAGIHADWSCLSHVALCLCLGPRSNQFNLSEHHVHIPATATSFGLVVFKLSNPVERTDMHSPISRGWCPVGGPGTLPF